MIWLTMGFISFILWRILYALVMVYEDEINIHRKSKINMEEDLTIYGRKI